MMPRSHPSSVSGLSGENRVGAARQNTQSERGKGDTKEEVVGGDQESKRRESELMNVLQGPSTYRQRVRETKHRRSISSVEGTHSVLVGVGRFLVRVEMTGMTGGEGRGSDREGMR